MHQPLIAIVGPSGSGKSTSLRNLPPERTKVLDLERKGLPFRGGSKFNISAVENAGLFDKEFQAALLAAKNKQIDLIVVESFTKMCEFYKKLAEEAYKGYEIWAFFAKKVRTILEQAKNEHVPVVFTAIDECITVSGVDGTVSSQRRIWVPGKEWEGKIEKEFLCVLYTAARKGKEGFEYVFQTNTDGVASAKTPMGMFASQYIPNDLAAVITAVKEYHS